MPGMLSQIVEKQRQQVEKMATTAENLQKLVRESLFADVPVMPLKNSPETGLRTIGLPIPDYLRIRLLAQKERLGLRSYKATIFAALRIGLTVLEKTVITPELMSPDPTKADKIKRLREEVGEWQNDT